MFTNFRTSFLFIALGAALLALERIVNPGIIAEVLNVGGLFFLVFGLIDLLQRWWGRRDTANDKSASAREENDE